MFVNAILILLGLLIIYCLSLMAFVSRSSRRNPPER